METELELCTSVYGDELVVVTPPEGGGLSLSLSQTSGINSVTLTISLNSSYPDSPPHLKLSQVRGYTHESSLLELLRTKAASSTPPELCCLDLFMAVKDYLESAQTQPPCPVCLETLEGALVTGPCHHSLHQLCFARYVHNHIESFRVSEGYLQSVRAAKASVSERISRLSLAEASLAAAHLAVSAGEEKSATLKLRLDTASSAPKKRALPPQRVKKGREGGQGEEEGECGREELLSPAALQAALSKALVDVERLKREAELAAGKLARLRQESAGDGGEGEPGRERGEEEEHLHLAHTSPIPCAVCRADLPLSLLSFYSPAILKAVRSGGEEGGGGLTCCQEDASVRGHLSSLQTQFSALWDRQFAKGGIIAEEGQGTPPWKQTK